MSSIKTTIKSVNKWIFACYVIAVAPLFFSTSTLAQSKPLCDAIQVSSEQLPVLDSQCPIGEGVWSKDVPSSSGSVYWIQCGMLDEVMSLDQSKVLYSQISTDVWMKPESTGYRCLLGPYMDSYVAIRELSKVKDLERYKDAFIRHVNRSATTKRHSTGDITNSTDPQALKETLISSSPVTSVISQISQVNSPSKPIPKRVKPVEPLPTTAQSSATIRFRVKVDNKQYLLPYLDGNYQFYMEHDLAWNRLDYPTAIKVCSDLNMRLVNSDEWQVLLASNVMTRDHWPVQLPYWGDGQKGLFASGKIVPVKASTQLNLVCVH